MCSRELVVTAWLGLASTVSALEPREVVVLVNQNEPASKQIADHYCKARGVPAENVVTVNVITNDDLGRTDYEQLIVKPVRAALAARRGQIRAIVTTYGIPIRIGRQGMTEAEQKEVAKIAEELKPLHADSKLNGDVIRELEELAKTTPSDGLKDRIQDKRKELGKINAKIGALQGRVAVLQHVTTESALDSELMLLWWGNYPRERWVINPLYHQIPEKVWTQLPKTLMTSRLDGPTPDVVKRMIDDSVAIEAQGLDGSVCVDARGIKFDAAQDTSGTQYGAYDESMREMAALLRTPGGLSVKLEDTEALLPPGSCERVALYCGWYSVNRYVPCCQFNRGAVAWHLASQEALSLHQPGTQWCANLLLNGVAATIGPVAEPYTVAFPKPAEFFGFLATGEYTLAECYARTITITSWQMMLIGDPLYNPYKKAPKLAAKDVQPSPRGTKVMLGP